MPRCVAIFEDNLESEVRWIRTQHAEEHFAYLAEHRDKILLGGGLRHAPGEWYCGGMWAMEVERGATRPLRCAKTIPSTSSGCGRHTGCTSRAKRGVMGAWNCS